MDTMQVVPDVLDYASGSWVVRPGAEEDFVRRWRELLTWTRASAPGLRWAMLIRDAAEIRHFISVAGWASAEQRRNWKSLPEFAEKFGACRALCDAFQGSDYQLTATV